MKVDDVQFKIAAARRMLYREGSDSGVAGHVSARADGEDAFWVTPFEYFDETTPDNVIKMSFDLEVLSGEAPSSPALQFHAAIYRERPDVRSIIHTHAHHVSVFSTTGRPIGMFNVVSVLFHDEQAFYEDDGTHPSTEGKRMAAALGDKRVLLMKNHGVLIASDSLENATIDAMTIEKAARFHIEAEAIGGTELPLAEVLQSRKDYDRYFRQMMWPANLRRLQRSDPDLFQYLD